MISSYLATVIFKLQEKRNITGAYIKILIISAVILASMQRAEAATWTTINGRVLTETGTPVCAMVLANGQHMFSCGGAGNYTLNVPLDSNNLITLQVFASGFAPYRKILTAGQAIGFDVSMQRDITGRAFTITHNESPTSRPGWVKVSGNIDYKGAPLCAMILINGQSMFSCNQNSGIYSLEVPRDSSGDITLQAFASGFMPHRDTFGVNDPPIATGQCDSTFQADTYSGILTATDPESTPLTYTLIDPVDGTPAGNGPITTMKGGTVEITDPTTGDFDYQPNPAAGGYRGMDTFQYQVTDLGQGNLSDKATETIIVNQTIMPLGDSITSGTGSSIVELERTGYRRDLQNTLAAAGYTFDFVGTDPKGSAAIPAFDYNNEGHGGWNAFQLANGGGQVDPDETDGDVFSWLDLNPADIVLLHAGTNGLTAGGTNANDVANGASSIIGRIREWENSANGNPVTVILALIVDQEPYDGNDVKDFNNNLEVLAIDRIMAGEDIILVDQYGALTYPDDMPDGTHPNTIGYSKMAAVWSDVLTDNSLGILDKCP